MDHSLSLRMTIRRCVEVTTLLSASSVIPHVNGPRRRTPGAHVLMGVVPRSIARRGHAERGAEGGAGVAGAKRVVFAFGAAEKTAGAARMADRAEEISAAAGEELVHVALMADVENDLVGGRREHPVQRDGELDDAQIGPHVAAVDRGDGDEFIADFLREPRELFGGAAPRTSAGLRMPSKQARLRLGWAAEGGASFIAWKPET